MRLPKTDLKSAGDGNLHYGLKLSAQNIRNDGDAIPTTSGNLCTIRCQFSQWASNERLHRI
jgi:hypothetical protein